MPQFFPPSPSNASFTSESLSPAPSFASSLLSSSNQATREDSLSNTSTITLPSEMDPAFNNYNNNNEGKSSSSHPQHQHNIPSNSNQSQVDQSGVDGSQHVNLDTATTTTSTSSTSNPRRTQRTRQPPPRNQTVAINSTSNQNAKESSASGKQQSAAANSSKSSQSNTASSSNNNNVRSTPRAAKKNDNNQPSTSNTEASPLTEDPRGPTRRGQPRKLFRYLQDYEALGLGSAQAAKEAAEQQSQAIASQQLAHNNAAAKGKGKKRASEELGPDGKPKRRNTAKACLFCKRSHMTCDDIRPCQRCVKRGIGHLCTDEIPGSAGAPAASHASSSASKGKGKASTKVLKAKSRRASETAVSAAAKASSVQKQSLKLPKAAKPRASLPGPSSATLDDDGTLPEKISNHSHVKHEFPAYVAAPSKPNLSIGNDSDSDSDSEDEDSRPLLKVEADRSIPTGVSGRVEPHEPALFHGDGPERPVSFSSMRRNTVQAEEFNVRTLGVQNGQSSHGLAPISTGNGYPLQIGNGKGRQLSPPQTATFPLDHSVYQPYSHPSTHNQQHHSSVSPHSYHTQPAIVHRMPTHPQSATIPSVSSFWPDESSIQSYHSSQHLHPHHSQGHQSHLHHSNGGMGGENEPDNSAVFEEFLRQHQQQQQQQQQSNGPQAPLDHSEWPGYGSAAYSHLHTRHMSLPQNGIGLGMGQIPMHHGMQTQSYEMNVSEPRFFPERPGFPSMDSSHSSQITVSRSNSFSHGVGVGPGQSSGHNNPPQVVDYQRSYHSSSPFSPDSRHQESMKQSHLISHHPLQHHHQHHQQVFDHSNQHSSSSPFNSYHSSSANSNPNSSGPIGNHVSSGLPQHHSDDHQHSNLDFTNNGEHSGLNMDHYLSQGGMGMQM